MDMLLLPLTPILTLSAGEQAWLAVASAGLFTPADTKERLADLDRLLGIDH